MTKRTTPNDLSAASGTQYEDRVVNVPGLSSLFIQLTHDVCTFQRFLLGHYIDYKNSGLQSGNSRKIKLRFLKLVLDIYRWIFHMLTSEYENKWIY